MDITFSLSYCYITNGRRGDVQDEGCGTKEFSPLFFFSPSLRAKRRTWMVSGCTSPPARSPFPFSSPYPSRARAPSSRQCPAWPAGRVFFQRWRIDALAASPTRERARLAWAPRDAFFSSPRAESTVRTCACSGTSPLPLGLRCARAGEWVSPSKLCLPSFSPSSRRGCSSGRAELSAARRPRVIFLLPFPAARRGRPRAPTADPPGADGLWFGSLCGKQEKR